MEKETVQIMAAPGQMEKVAQALIRLADHPHDVVWASRGGHFVVPEEVAVRYVAEQAGELAAAAEAGQADEPAAKPRARRRAPAKPKPVKAAGDEQAKPRSRRGSRGKQKEGGES